MLYTEFEFTLPKGLVDDQGAVHRHGIMRLVTGKDEIVVQKDRFVRDNPGYSILSILSKVIIQLGTLSSVTPQELEQLFLVDLTYLQDVFNQINDPYVELAVTGELMATP
ncbi:MAG: hypothetical protein ACOC0N_12925 [Chroococcales cyanobacterium]